MLQARSMTTGHAVSSRVLLRLVLPLLVLALAAPSLAAETLDKLTGHLNVVWGDPAPGSPQAPLTVFHLTNDEGRTVELEVSSALLRLHGGLAAWDGRRVEATVVAPVGPSTDPLRVRSVHFLGEEAALGGVTGSQPWVSILCKFQDIGDEPEDLTFFQDMYANTPGGLDHYWREVSYNTIDIVGSTAIDWVVLPNNHTFYVPTPGSGTTASLGVLFNDCTAAADPFVDYGNGGDPFVGINMMFNALLDCCAWGGGRFATLDGVSQNWRVTWDPPWAYANEAVIAHEMGHGFGLPHSTNYDNDGNPYDTPWDVMSAATGYAVLDPTYGRLGKHVLAYHKSDRLGWVPAEQIFEPAGDGSFNIVLDNMVLATTTNHRIARIPIEGSNRWYTVEVRKRVGNYDGNVPGDAVIICEVDPTRGEPAWTVDSDVPPADYADNEGTMWRVGETFTDSAAQISIEVTGETTDGFNVRITLGETSIFSDGFESGDTSSWG
ncbi:MAG: hypothetical protein AAF560_26310 [Acidobacteriota bacterium]